MSTDAPIQNVIIRENNIVTQSWASWFSFVSRQLIKRNYRTVKSVNVDYTVEDNIDCVLIDSSGASVGITLPVSLVGRSIVVKKKNSGAHTITISSGGNIEGSASYSLTGGKESVSLVCDGLDWWVV